MESLYMAFFRENAANLVQLLSLPLEIAGLGLATIEVLFPKKAMEMTNFLDLFSDKEYFETNRADKYKKWITIIFYTLSFLGFLFLEPIVNITNNKRALITFYLFMTIGFPVSILLFINLLDHFGIARSVGITGLTMAGIGTLGEVYQVITMLTN